VGTFALSFIVVISIASRVSFPYATPLLAALTLGLFVYSVGSISGAHLNPAVTIGLLSIRKISLQKALYYVLAQIAGVILTVIVARLFLFNAGLSLSTVGSWRMFFAEAIGTFFFTFGIASVVFEGVPASLSGAVVGGSLFLGIAAGSFLGSAGVLNPAVAFGLSSYLTGGFSLAYLLGPVLGSVIGMRMYRFLVE
jgi:glycerol uptake facilitator-like aquaporin